MNNKVHFSIITVCLNSERYISETLDSVIKQNYESYEHIIIDGGSTDSTLEILNMYEKKSEGHIRWLSEKDNGLYYAMNKGIGLARGELIGILNSDDIYEEGVFKYVWEKYEANSLARLLYGNTKYINCDGDTISINSGYAIKDLNKYTFWDIDPYCHQAAFIHRSIYETYGGYDTTYRICADYEYKLRIMKSQIQSEYMEAFICKFRFGGISSNLKRTMKDVKAIQQKYGAGIILSNTIYFKVLFISELKKYLFNKKDANLLINWLYKLKHILFK